MDTSRHIIPEISNRDEKIRVKDESNILNLVNLDKISINTYITYTPTEEKNVLYIPECYKNILLIIKLSYSIDIKVASPIPDHCKFIIKLKKEKNSWTIPEKNYDILTKFLQLLPENTDYLNLCRLEYPNFNQDINQYLPRNLKSYMTFAGFEDSLDNLPQNLLSLRVFPAKEEYNYAFLPITLHTLEIANRYYINADGDTMTLPKLEHLPPGLKVLSLNSYEHSLATLPKGLEKLFIGNYHNVNETDGNLYLPPKLKALQIGRLTMHDNGYEKIEYPPKLEYLDIDCKVDITNLPPTLKSVGLYGFNLNENIIDIPKNITTIYTGDEFIEQLPSHVKRVIVIIKHPGGVDSSRIRVGDVQFEIDTQNTDECFDISWN